MATVATLEDQVLASLRRIIRATDIHSRKLNKDTGLTTPQLVVMRAIAAGDCPTASDIARAVSLSQATVTTLLNRLEERALVSLERIANMMDAEDLDAAPLLAPGEDVG